MIFDKIVNKCIDDFVVWDNNYKKTVFKHYVLSVLKELNKEKSNTLKCGTRCIIISSILIKRVQRLEEVNQDNIKEYFIPAMIIAFKLTEDNEYKQLFGSVFKISSKKIFELEMKFCNNLNHKLFVSNNQFNNQLITLIKF
jgi:hypothetical protein